MGGVGDVAILFTVLHKNTCILKRPVTGLHFESLLDCEAVGHQRDSEKFVYRTKRGTGWSRCPRGKWSLPVMILKWYSNQFQLLCNWFVLHNYFFCLFVPSFFQTGFTFFWPALCQATPKIWGWSRVDCISNHPSIAQGIAGLVFT